MKHSRLFNQRPDHSRPPIWFMRQAGRYHAHYQNIKKQHDFMSMCKNPTLACDVTLGPIADFGFDAAILFSDLLFPLECLGMGLTYNPGPELSFHLKSTHDLEKLTITTPAENFFQFQADAVALLRQQLPSECSLIGFVGAPFTLYTYAVEGSHQGQLVEAKKGLYDGRFETFWNKLKKPLLTEMMMQAEAGADVICLFDTAVGELSFDDYKEFVISTLHQLLKDFKQVCPDTYVLYYSRNTHLPYLKQLIDLPIDAIGVDWRHQLPLVFEELQDRFFIQGNIDPAWLFLPWNTLEKKLTTLISSMKNNKKINLNRWIFGLGHGVLPGTPEQNVKQTVAFLKSSF